MSDTLTKEILRKLNEAHLMAIYTDIAEVAAFIRLAMLAVKQNDEQQDVVQAAVV